MKQHANVQNSSHQSDIIVVGPLLGWAGSNGDIFLNHPNCWPYENSLAGIECFELVMTLRKHCETLQKKMEQKMTYGEFLRTIRKYCVNRKISNESLVNEPIEGLIKFSRIRKQKGSETGELLYYEITESSRIINNKLDVSPRLRDALEKTEAEEAAKEGFIRFYKNHIDNNVLKDMIENFMDLIDEDKSFKKSELSAIKVTVFPLIVGALKLDFTRAPPIAIVMFSSCLRFSSSTGIF